MSIESVMLSYHLILSHPLLLLPSIFPSKVETQCSFISKYVNVYFLKKKKKDILLHNHSAVIKIRKWTLVKQHYLIFRPYSDFTNCHTTVVSLAQKPVQDNPFIYLSYLFSLTESGQSSDFSFHHLDQFEEKKQLCCGMSFNLSVSKFFL